MSMKAKLDDVKYDQKAVEFHAMKFESGSTYLLAKQCFQLLQMKLNRSTYEVYKEETDGNNTKS